MKLWTSFALVLLGGLVLSTVSYHPANFKDLTAAGAQAIELPNHSTTELTAPDEAGIETRRLAVARYTLDAGQSRFMVRAFSGGLLWFKGHDHFIAVRDFSGEAQLTPGASSPASLQMTIRADSLVETRDVFTEQQKQIINRELREIVLETAKYPEITFKSTDVAGRLDDARYEAKIGGDLTLHGVTRRVVIPAEVTLDGGGLRARGEFTIDRGDFNVKATSALNGTIRVRKKLKFTFEIVARPA